MLQASNTRVVFAESCTCGRVAAALGEVPGISATLCGSFVVYRNASKQGWLGIPAELLNDPDAGPVSMPASKALAVAALEHTPEADLSVAVTGDVGPGASNSTDGKIFLAAAHRKDQSVVVSRQEELQLASAFHPTAEPIAVRRQRLEEATELVLRFAGQSLQ